MAVTYENVKEAGLALLGRGESISQSNIRRELGEGSFSTIGPHQKKLLSELQDGLKMDSALLTLPKELHRPMEALWRSAVTEARKAYDAAKAEAEQVAEQAQAKALEAESMAEAARNRAEIAEARAVERGERITTLEKDNERLGTEVERLSERLQSHRALHEEAVANLRAEHQAQVEALERDNSRIRDELDQKLQKAQDRVDFERNRNEEQERHWIMEVSRARDTANEAQRIMLEERKQGEESAQRMQNRAAKAERRADDAEKQLSEMTRYYNQRIEVLLERIAGKDHREQITEFCDAVKIVQDEHLFEDEE